MNVLETGPLWAGMYRGVTLGDNAESLWFGHALARSDRDTWLDYKNS